MGMQGRMQFPPLEKGDQGGFETLKKPPPTPNPSQNLLHFPQICCILYISVRHNTLPIHNNLPSERGSAKNMETIQPIQNHATSVIQAANLKLNTNDITDGQQPLADKFVHIIEIKKAGEAPLESLRTPPLYGYDGICRVRKPDGSEIM
ncbi:hypothetical protein CEE37_01600 [candidate division LCP-89 bacterium B3_LCP]|uniref:Uncharacterized protein n=1 Tax=candidate division LCP-89 bacterium B3_LCP TaxID=2012998 RepID=A0A532V5B6_UNCL8|nr:MAG: hypothetical protein CEE37_01600 [candidate division LCP-89 bacterium B3_LCP]